MSLTNGHMRGLWTEGYIMGFVSKQRGDEMLLSKDKGCFLLRFSDSELGGVSISYVSQEQEQKSVYHVSPYTNRDLSQRSIVDTIFDLDEHLTFLYPTVPKDSLRKFIEATQQPNKGYVPSPLRRHLEGNYFVEYNNKKNTNM